MSSEPTNASSELTSTSRLARNVAWNGISQIIGPLVAVVSTPILLRGLGLEGFGILAALSFITNFLWFMDLGVGQAATKYLAEHHLSGDREAFRDVFWTSSAVFLTAALVAAALLCLAAPTLPRLLHVSPEQERVAVAVFRWGAVAFALGMAANGPAAIPRALRRFDAVGLMSAFAVIGQPATVVVLLAFGRSLIDISIALAGLAGVQLLLHCAIAQRFVPGLWPPSVRVSQLRAMMDFGVLSSAHVALGAVLEHSDKLLISARLGILALPTYSIPYNLASRAGSLPRSLHGVLLPTFSGLSSGYPRTILLFMISVRWTLMIGLPLSVFLATTGPALIRLWLGPELPHLAGTVLQILAVATFLWSASWPAYAVLFAFGRPGVVVGIQFGSALCYLPAAYLMIDSFGVLGASAAWLLRTTAEGALILWASRSVIHWPFPALRAFVVRVTLVWVVLATLTSGGLLVASQVSTSFSAAAVQCAAAGVIVAAASPLLVWRLLLTDEERTAASRVGRKWLARACAYR